jgi:hypothetical protein
LGWWGLPFILAGVGFKHPPHPDSRQNVIFHSVHYSIGRFGSIVEAAQVQHAVEGVKQHLLLQGAPGAAACFGHTNHYFTAENPPAGIFVEGEREHIGWSGDLHELLVKLAHPPIAHQGQRQLPQRRVQEGMGGGQFPAEVGEQLFARGGVNGKG